MSALSPAPLFQATRDDEIQATSSTTSAARQIQRQSVRFATFHCCETCDRVLSIPEVIERHCERCNAFTRLVEVREAA
jgi:hypothetical protein